MVGSKWATELGVIGLSVSLVGGIWQERTGASLGTRSGVADA